VKNFINRGQKNITILLEKGNDSNRIYIIFNIDLFIGQLLKKRKLCFFKNLKKKEEKAKYIIQVFGLMLNNYLKKNNEFIFFYPKNFFANKKKIQFFFRLEIPLFDRKLIIKT
jgi:hypothetical protein